MFHENMFRKSVSDFPNDSKLRPWSDKILKMTLKDFTWYSVFEIVFCRDILLGFVESYEKQMKLKLSNFLFTIKRSALLHRHALTQKEMVSCWSVQHIWSGFAANGWVWWFRQKL